jgi:hypothetical protein
MPKRSYHTEDFVPTYESGYTKVARLQSELVAGSQSGTTETSLLPGSSFVADNVLVEFPITDSEEDSCPAHNSTHADTPVPEQRPTTTSPGLLEELLQMDAPVYEDGPPTANDDLLFDQYFAEHQEGGTVTEEVADNEQEEANHPTGMDFGITDHAMVDLIQCCNNAGTSIKFLDQFLCTLKKHVKKGFDVLKAPKRTNFMEKLRGRLGAPKAEIVASSHGYIVPRYDFLDQVLDLFSMPYFQDPASCCMNTDEVIRFLQYVPPEDEGDSEIMGAQWARQTMIDLMERLGPTYTDPDTGIVYIHFFCPGIHYTDKTGVGQMQGKYTLEPVMFTLAVLRRHIREKADAWRHLGFIPKHNSGTGSEDEEENEADAEERLAVYHELLSLILESLEKYQRTPPLLHIRLFGQMVHVRPIFEVAFVIGDQLSQDHLCGRKKINSGGAGRAHRSCNCGYETAGCCEEQCQPVDQSTVRQLSSIIRQGEHEETRLELCRKTHPIEDGLSPRDPLIKAVQKKRNSLSSFLKVRASTARDILEKTFGLYPIENAWYKISFGSNANGIYLAAVDDPFHFSEAGLFEYLLRVAFKGLLPADAKRVEKYMREDFSARSSVRYDFPRGKFSPGFSNCTLLTGSEKVGLVYSLYLSLGTKRVADVFRSNILRQQNKYVDTGICYDALGYTDPNSRPPESSLPRVWDQYYFSDLRHKRNADKAGRVSDNYELTRNRRTMRRVVDHLDSFGLLFLVDPAKPLMDRLQTEYLVQTVWHRTARKTDWVFNASAKDLQNGDGDAQLTTEVDKDKAASILFSTIRRGAPPLSYGIRRNLTTKDTASSPQAAQNNGTIRNFIHKHWIKKPKVKGRGDTSAILTDVDGFRRVLEYALVFHSVVHELHNLDPSLQKDFSNLDSRLRELMSVIVSGIYRGDNSVDTNTGKIHSHLHLPETCRLFGAPMNFDAAKGERGLKQWAKHVSRTARKCGDAMFITQTANRVSDNQLLSKASRLLSVLVSAADSIAEDTEDDLQKWGYSRKSHHISYSLETMAAKKCEGKTSTPIDNNILLSSQICQLLKKQHGEIGTVQIWREMFVNLGEGAKQYVRAFDTYDKYGSYFDWVQVKEVANCDTYYPAKALLLYRVDGKDFVLCWKAMAATATERNKETNLSARWKMQFGSNGLAELVSVPTDTIRRCLHVFEHRKTKELPIPSLPVPAAERAEYVIDESYDRYAWALNFLDARRWSQ